MDTSKDITTREDIENLVTGFYEVVKKDPVIGFIFTVTVPINWQHHIPLIVDFWETILLDHPIYKKNTMEVHYDLNKKIPLKKEYFSQWVLLFCNTVDELFIGKIATLAKTRATSIAAVMEVKMNGDNKTMLG